MAVMPSSLALASRDLPEPLLGNKNQPRVLMHRVFLRPPQFMDVCAFGSRKSTQKTLRPCAPSDGAKMFGTSSRISDRTSAGYPPKHFFLGCFPVPDLLRTKKPGNPGNSSLGVQNTTPHLRLYLDCQCPLAQNQYINNSPGFFPVFARMQMQARHVFASK